MTDNTDSKNNITNKSLSLPIEDDINLNDFFSKLKREKKTFLTVSLATLILCGINYITRKPVWEGEFQIVIANKRQKSSLADSLMGGKDSMLSLVGFKGGNNKIFTDIQILKSPYVLMPVFDYVKKVYSEKELGKLTFKNWLRSNLKVELIRKTSILNISYRDTDKELVGSVLNRISKVYQDYSDRDRKDTIKTSIKYLDQQIKVYKELSQQAYRKEQEYSIDNELSLYSVLQVPSLESDRLTKEQIFPEQLKSLNKLSSNSNRLTVQVLRVKYSNELRELKAKIRQVNSLDGNDINVRKFLIPEISSKARARNWKDEALAYLQSKVLYNKAKLDSLERPKEVLVKYRELLREASRTDTILKSLEQEKQKITLEKAKAEDLWKLISTSTVFDKPISPSKKIHLLVGLLLSSFFGTISALYNDKRKGFIYSKEELKTLISSPFLGELTTKEGGIDYPILLSILEKASKEERKVELIILTASNNNDLFKEIKNQLNNSNYNKSFNLTNNYMEASTNEEQILLLEKGSLKKEDLIRLNQYYKIINKNIEGWLIIDKLFKDNT